jgi:hypothetical protein
MPGTGALSRVGSPDEFVHYRSLWDIGAAGAHTKAAGVNGKGFTGIARTAAGKYTVTMADMMPVGPFVGAHVEHFGVADAAPTETKVTKASWNPTTRTFLYENWSEGGAPAQTELASGDQVMVDVWFQKTK